ncbi:DsbA family protein [Agrococcus jejuensis]|uniref:DsbA family protein n=1 Tax=Agrococcus jejuensis TaxID=399736 RepID=UPI0011A7BEFD|nr:thioredoxin domain-containing protein [Agrococcus jejuensis]
MRLRTRRAGAGLVGCAALLLVAGCAQGVEPIGPQSLGELSAAYVDAGGACTDLVEQYRASDDDPAVATCGTDTVLTLAADDAQASRLRTGALLHDVPVLWSGRWMVQDADVEALQETIGGQIARLEPADGPANLADALVVDADGVVEQDAVPADGEPDAVPADGTVVTVVVDPTCEYCARFLEANGDQLAEWAADGTATIAYVPVAIDDAVESGYASSLGVAALACVADAEPDAALPFIEAMLERNVDLDAAGVVELADEALDGAGDCVTQGTFAWWTRQATERALAGALPDDQPLGGVPSVYVGDRLYSGDVADAGAFAAFVAAG